jgi:ectoine hydroxylase-related dioxygenase (phytanoyl-CoA dioxygenase family)
MRAICIFYYLRCKGDEILVIKNCVKSEFFYMIDEDSILERIPVRKFIAGTKKFYMDFIPGDTMLFLKNTIHMSDHRTSSKERVAFNFRVAIVDS